MKRRRISFNSLYRAWQQNWLDGQLTNGKSDVDMANSQSHVISWGWVCEREHAIEIPVEIEITLCRNLFNIYDYMVIVKQRLLSNGVLNHMK